MYIELTKNKTDEQTNKELEAPKSIKEKKFLKPEIRLSFTDR